MIEKVLQPKNLYKAYRQVVSNKGSGGVDGMKVSELKVYKDQYRDQIATDILSKQYLPTAIKGVEIPKPKGDTRLLGVPTVIDRWLQQAVSQQLAPIFELNFEEESFGFRPQKNTQKAVRESLKHINDEYQDIVDIDLKGFFDETVRRCGTALQTPTIDLSESKVSDDFVAHPKVVACADPYQGSAVQTPHRSTTRQPLESAAIEHIARSTGQIPQIRRI